MIDRNSLKFGFYLDVYYRGFGVLGFWGFGVFDLLAAGFLLALYLP